MNSESNPIWTLAWTFGLMSLFAVGGANAAIPEMHRATVALARHHPGRIGTAVNRADGRQRPDFGAASDPTWPAALVTIAAAALAFATRLNPLWMLLAGGCFGFCWRYLRKIGRQVRRTGIWAIQKQNGRQARAGE